MKAKIFQTVDRDTLPAPAHQAELGERIARAIHEGELWRLASLHCCSKRLRLQEARRLILGDGLDAMSATSRVGYHNAAYFNRKYKSLFGLPPVHDVERLQGTARENVSL